MSGSKSSVPSVSPESERETAPLGLTVHQVNLPDVAQARQARGRWQMLLVLACCAAPVVASYFTYFVIRPEGRSNYSDLIPAHAIPAQLPLTRLSGETIPASALKDQWLLAIVSGGACDDRCENNLTVQARLRETLGRDKDRVDKVWFITDEAEPSAATLAALKGVEVVRVPRSDLAQWLQPAAGQVLEDHLYIIDPMGQWMMRAPPIPSPKSDPVPSAKLKKDMERLLRASASWDQAGRLSHER